MAVDFIKDANSIEQIVDGINTAEESPEIKNWPPTMPMNRSLTMITLAMMKLKLILKS